MWPTPSPLSSITFGSQFASPAAFANRKLDIINGQDPVAKWLHSGCNFELEGGCSAAALVWRHHMKKPIQILSFILIEWFFLPLFGLFFKSYTIPPQYIHISTHGSNRQSIPLIWISSLLIGNSSALDFRRGFENPAGKSRQKSRPDDLPLRKK